MLIWCAKMESVLLFSARLLLIHYFHLNGQFYHQQSVAICLSFTDKYHHFDFELVFSDFDVLVFVVIILML